MNADAFFIVDEGQHPLEFFRNVFGFRFDVGKWHRVLVEVTLVEQMQIDKAVVFIRKVAYYQPAWYIRNEIDLSGPVIYAIDRGEKLNKLVAARFPGYDYLIYRWNPVERKREIKPVPYLNK